MPPDTFSVLQLLPALVSGGVERGTLEIARALIGAGQRSIVVSAGGPLVNQLTAEGSSHITLPLDRKTPLVLWQVPRLRRMLETLRPDIVHARSRLPAWIAWLALRGMPAATRPRFVTTVHGLYSVGRYSAIMARGDVVIAVSETARRYVLDHYPACPEAQIRVIHRGVATAEFPSGHRPELAWLAGWYQSYPQLRDAIVITIAGRMTRRKGHDTFLRLIAALRRDGVPAHGLVVGGAAREGYERELRRTVAQRQLGEAITFTGARDDIREVLASSNLVVALSTLPESFGRTALEALSLGVPVLGWGHGGVGEILAALFPEGSVPPFDEAELVQRARTLLRRGGGQVPSVTPFPLERMCQQTIDVYRELVRGPGSAPAS